MAEGVAEEHLELGSLDFRDEVEEELGGKNRHGGDREGPAAGRTDDRERAQRGHHEHGEESDQRLGADAVHAGADGTSTTSTLT